MVRVFVLCALVAATPAFGAQTTAPQAQPSSASPVAPAPVKEKKVCRVESSGTGSILPTRICHTQAEWDAITQSSQAQAEQLLERQQQTTYGSR